MLMLRRMTDADAEIISAWDSTVENGDHCYALCDGDQPLGWVSASDDQITIRVQRRGVGRGTRALELLLEKHQDINFRATVENDNWPAHRLFQRFGFKKTATVYSRFG